MVLLWVWMIEWVIVRFSFILLVFLFWFFFRCMNGLNIFCSFLFGMLGFWFEIWMSILLFWVLVVILIVLLYWILFLIRLWKVCLSDSGWYDKIMCLVILVL